MGERVIKRGGEEEKEKERQGRGGRERMRKEKTGRGEMKVRRSGDRRRKAEKRYLKG
jgi:hypothetical protein